VEELIEALAQRASVSLVGEPGVGKTCVLRALSTTSAASAGCGGALRSPHSMHSPTDRKRRPRPAASSSGA
jgi:ABC-type phosphate/phosphonate transport system ATPase subunit